MYFDCELDNGIQKLRTRQRNLDTGFKSVPFTWIKAIIKGKQKPDEPAALSIGKWELLPDSGDNEINSQQVGFPKMRENQFDKFAWVVHHLW